MSAGDFTIEHARWDDASDQQALRQIRQAVYIDEQHVPVEEEWDDLDASSEHVLARDAAGQPIGTGRLTPEHKIGRMAVLQPWRGRGVGAALLRVLIERARERRLAAVEIHAQVDAMGFYQRFGFMAFGEPFDEAGIRHRHMRLALAPLPPAPAERGVQPPWPESRPLACSGRDETKAAVLALLADARHQLAVHSRDLDPEVFDDVEVLDALRRLAGSGRGALLRFLLHDPARVLRDGHRLVALAQRLPSAVQLRVPVEEDDLAYPSAFVVNDAGGYLLRPLAGRYEGRGCTCERTTQGPLLRYFDEVWARSEEAAELRPLGI